MIARLLPYRLPIILLLAALIRLAVLLAFPSVFAFDQIGTIHGSEAYDNYAVSLNATGIYGQEAGVADAAIPPMYGYALSLIYRLFGRGYLQVGIFHITLDLISIALLYEIALRLFLQTRFPAQSAAALSALFYALYPYLIFQNLTLIDTPFFIMLLHAFVLLMILLREEATLNRRAWVIAAAGGVILGIATLTRPITPPLALLVAVWFLFRLNLWQTILRLLPVALISALLLVPWIARNFAEFDAFIPMTTTSGANFWQGNSEYTVPVFRAGYDVQWTSPAGVPSTYRDREADAQRFALAFEFLRENPDKIPELLWTKFLIHWSIDIAPRYNPRENEQFRLDENGELQVVRADRSIVGVNEANTSYNDPLFDQIGRWIHRFYYGGLFFLALAGLFLTRFSWREMSLLWFVQISMTVIYIIFHPSTRYRVPTDPLLFVLSAAAVLVFWGTLRRWRGAESGA